MLPFTGAKTRDMAIREASAQGQYATLPAGSDRRVPRACQESGPPDAPKPGALLRKYPTAGRTWG
jgi:hypothetical protein